MRRGLVLATLAIAVAALAAIVASQHFALSIGPLPEPHRAEPGIEWPPCPPLPSDAALVPTLSPVQEAEIYRTFLQDILKKFPGSSALYLRPTTVIPEPPPGSSAESFWGYLCASVPSLDQTTLRSFRVQNERRGRLRTFFGLSVPYRFVGNNGQVRRAVSGPVRNPYIFALSRAGLNDAATQALLYVEEDCGPGATKGYFLLLARVSGVWRIQQRIPAWIS